MRSPSDMQKNSIFSRSIYTSAIFLCGALMMFMMNFFQVVVTDGPSMEPTFVPGQRLVFCKSFTVPKPGDIVLIHKNGKLMVKRVLASPGQSVQATSLDDPTALTSYSYWEEAKDFPEPVTVPEGYLFVTGDNPAHSYDSRYPDFGLVSLEELEGVLFYPKA